MTMNFVWRNGDWRYEADGPPPKSNNDPWYPSIAGRMDEPAPERPVKKDGWTLYQEARAAERAPPKPVDQRLVDEEMHRQRGAASPLGGVVWGGK